MYNTIGCGKWGFTMNRKYRSLMLTIVDLIVVGLSYFLALWIRFDFSFRDIKYFRELLQLMPYIIIIYFVFYKLFKVDKTLWSSPSVDEALRVSISSGFSAVIVYFLIKYIGNHSVPLSVAVIAGFIIILVLEFLRFGYRAYRTLLTIQNNTNPNFKRTLIIGAGQAGQLLLKEILNNKAYQNNIIGFLDDDPLKVKKIIGGFPVLGCSNDVVHLVHEHKIDVIYIAMPSVSIKRQNEIAKLCYETGKKAIVLTSTEDMMTSAGIRRNLREINIEDLLGRKEIKLENNELEQLLKDKRILISGAGGSIGSELVRQIIKFNPKSIVMMDINENSLYEIQQEFNIQRKEGVITDVTNYYPIITSVRDYYGLELVFEAGKFDVVFHAAAHKHVPLMETMPLEAIKNNIFGSYNMIEMAKRYKVGTFVSISTDKAVNPTNVMGATKRFVEKMIQAETSNSTTKFVAVRFGNVLGSNGSVIPLFKKQIASGGPVTVTHPDIIRYFMTIPEAVSLVLQAATYGDGGEIFVLDMGEPVRIVDLAEKMIFLAGYRPNIDIEIKYTGLRPGEKLYEELLMDEEGLAPTPNKLIRVAMPMRINRDELQLELAKLKKAISSHLSREEIIEVLQEVVTTYKPS